MSINLISNHLTQSFQAISIRHFTPLQKKILLVASILWAGLAIYYVIKNCTFIKTAQSHDHKKNDDNKLVLNLFNQAITHPSKGSEPPNDSFTMLPDEIKMNIFSYLKGEDLAKIPLVCNDFARVINDESTWNTRIVELIGQKKAQKFFDAFQSWKSAYINYVQMQKEGEVLSPTTIITDEAKLIGEISNGKLNGKGKKIISHFEYEEGMFKDNILQQGKKIDSSGIYEGDFKEGNLQGNGKITWKGLTIEGEFKDGELNGHAKITFQGREWEGEFKENISEQQTRIALHKDKIIIGGKYEKRELQGQAIVIKKDNSLIEGEFKNGYLINGKCKSGTITKEGKFKDGRLYKGKLIDFSGNTHEGKFIRGSLNGKGKIIKANGKILEGEFEEGSLIEGQVTYNDGKVIQGEFTITTVNYGQKRTLNNGTITYPDGRVEKYENGVIVT